MNVIFAGTPKFAAEVLAALHHHVNIIGVFTQPDKPQGRGRKLSTSAVKQYAQVHHLPLFQPSRIAAADLDCLAQADVMVVVAYGQILPNDVLNIPRYGCINIHASLLPRWRGAAPIERAILAGDRKSGISIIQMNHQLDSGGLIAQQGCPISADDNGRTLSDKLLKIAKMMIVEILKQLPIKPVQQAKAGVTYAHKLSKGEAWINWHHDAAFIARQIRAFNPYPMAQCYASSIRFERALLRILAAQVAAAVNPHAKPGCIINQSKQGIDVACGSGVLSIQKLQLAGRKPLSASEFINAHQLITLQ